MTHTRRAFVAGIATVATTATATADTFAPDDPIFAAIARHRRACDALSDDAIAANDATLIDAASREHIAADEALFKTVPTTIGGCKALIEYVLEATECDDDTDVHRTLVVLSAALASA